MTGLEIGLLIFGVLLFVGSFFFTEKLSSSDIDTIKKMSKSDINVLLDDHLKEASVKIDQVIETRFTDTMNRFDREANKRTTDEIYSISEHGDTVRETIDQKINELKGQFDELEKYRKEIVFLHNMLSDKQEKVTELEKEAQKLQSSLHNMKRSVEDAIERLSIEQQIQVVSHAGSLPEKQESRVQSSMQVPKQTVETTVSSREAVHAADLLLEQLERNIPGSEENELSVSEINPQEAAAVSSGQVDNAGVRKVSPAATKIAKPGNINERILTMHREGYSDVDIARRLDKGLGEIRLVLGLFDEGDAS